MLIKMNDFGTTCNNVYKVYYELKVRMIQNIEYLGTQISARNRKYYA